ncbi:hypothetical protein LZ575_01575 [Antarcticibacterium sp. 1MA-6-2]|uniref:hypothetical protein n=1 Tax=Antarcticibacterium sp. 1MA-6-2 TaxID=2908210 RepID=UPI001F240726|nr:hypothetical protein [Antarcticibacterium sp. 1MA-6-2]UJH91479.1 hypothetical protein LZ575_01575 [Antarcticibacterium sp. 1MA-6-2]
MRIYSALLLMAIFFTSCDDGDIIVTTFEFEEDAFTICGDGNSKVLYHINNEDVFETLSVQITNGALSNEDDKLIKALTSLSLPLDPGVLPPIRIVLTGNNQVIYRTYDGTIPARDYFCRDIPPASPKVLQEYRSVGGEIVITTNITYGNITDHDEDGIPSNLEGMDSLQDTDGDGIPDFLDKDDDGDNVATSFEIRDSIEADDPTVNDYPDTDGDGIPNYLDTDDDQDGVPTRREVTEANQDPRQNNNEGGVLYLYLDRFSSNSYSGEIDFKVSNDISIRYTSFIEARNLKLQKQDGDGEEISFVSKILGVYNSSGTTPIDVDNSEEENPDEEETEENGGE